MSTLNNFRIGGKSIVGDVFVETGFHRGGSFQHALHAGFAELHSIDLVEAYVDNAWKKFGHEFGRVHFYCGTSPQVLWTMKLDPTKRTTFWLDSHYQCDGEHERDPEYGECPLLLELCRIMRTRWSEPPVILVDDAGMFKDKTSERFKGFDPEQWPSIQDMLLLLPGYDLVEREDVLYFLPKGWEGWGMRVKGRTGEKRSDCLATETYVPSGVNVRIDDRNCDPFWLELFIPESELVEMLRNVREQHAPTTEAVEPVECHNDDNDKEKGQQELAEKVAVNFGRCPYCGSGDLSARDYDGDRILSVAVRCETCDATWSEHYRFVNATDFEPGEE